MDPHPGFFPALPPGAAPPATELEFVPGASFSPVARADDEDDAAPQEEEENPNPDPSEDGTHRRGFFSYLGAEPFVAARSHARH